MASTTYDASWQEAIDRGTIMMPRGWKSLKLAGVLILSAMACRPPTEPPPTLYQDLGTEDRPLLPTSAAFHDASVAKGSAEWHAFRKPDADAKPAAPSGERTTGGAPIGDEKAAEIREVVADFNTAVQEGKFDEVADFVIQEQAAAAKQVVEVLPQFAAKLSELAAALPGDNEKLKKVAASLTLPTILKLDVTAIQGKGASEAIAKSGEAEVRFVLVKEEEGEFWYIDHPQIRAMGPSLPALQQSVSQLDGMIAGLKSGQVSQEVATQQAAAMDQMLSAFLPPGAEKAKPAEDETAASDEKPQADGDEE